jgi:small-conductance mechanosensitive channel
VVIALHLLDALDTAVSLLYGLRLQIGSLDVSAYGILTGAVVLVFMLWFAQMASRMVSKRISSITSLSPSIKVLIGKAVTIILIATAILVSVDSMGLDLTVLSVLGGGLGVGLGFGLQKVVSNFVSGLILLTDRSIKPGDVIEIDETYGWINTLSARYVSVITRDGTEHLIPNEDLITQKVINWSFTNNLVRLRIPVGVAYDCDIHLARKLILDASNTPERVLRQPAPICHLLGFGDSSVDFELRVWINDPSNGIANVKSAILLKTWDLFKEHDIEIPFPQRDLHLKPPAAIDVTLKRDRPAKV